MAPNAVILPSFLTESTILYIKTSVVNLLKVFAKCIAEKEEEKYNNKLSKEEEDDVNI